MTRNASIYPYNIKGDGKTDNAAGFRKLQKDMAVSNQKEIVFLPSGVVLSSFTYWTVGVERFKIIGNNTYLKSLYTGNDEAQKRGLFAGEMMQTNALTYKGTKEYVTPDAIEPAKAGDIFISLDNVTKYRDGEMVFIGSGNLFSGGYPRAYRAFDWIDITFIDLSGIHLSKPLTQNFTDEPVIFPIDNYCRHAEFEGIRFSGNFAYPAETLILRDCEIDEWLWISECRNVFTYNVRASKVEADKLVHSWKDYGLKTASAVTNGGSINNIEMTEAETGSILLCPRNLKIIRPRICADMVIKDEDQKIYDYNLSCIADAPAHNPIRSYEIEGAILSNTSDNKATSNAEFAKHDEFWGLVDGNDIIVIGQPGMSALEVVARMEENVTVINNEDGTNGGLITAIQKEAANNYRLKGNWKTPKTGELWVWSYIKNFIDHGNHITLNDRISFGDDSLRWQGNTSTTDIKTMVLTEKDFPGGNRRVRMNAEIIGITEYWRNKPSQIEIINVEPYESLFKTGQSAIYVNKWSKYLDLIGAPGVGDRFTVKIEWRSY